MIILCLYYTGQQGTDAVDIPAFLEMIYIYIL